MDEQEEAKQKLFKTMDETEVLSQKDSLSQDDELLLRNLEVKKMIYYSRWKD